MLHLETAVPKLFFLLLSNSCAVKHLSEPSRLSQVIISCYFCHFNPTFLNPFLRPHLAGLPASPARPSTFCPCVNISHCCCRWCVMRGTERSLCVRSVGAAVCGSPACGVSWQACGCWRQPAACLSSVCLFSYTWPTLTSPYLHTHVEEPAHTPIYIALLDMVLKIQINGHCLAHSFFQYRRLTWGFDVALMFWWLWINGCHQNLITSSLQVIWQKKKFNQHEFNII